MGGNKENPLIDKVKSEVGKHRMTIIYTLYVLAGMAGLLFGLNDALNLNNFDQADLFRTSDVTKDMVIVPTGLIFALDGAGKLAKTVFERKRRLIQSKVQLESTSFGSIGEPEGRKSRPDFPKAKTKSLEKLKP